MRRQVVREVGVEAGVSVETTRYMAVQGRTLNSTAELETLRRFDLTAKFGPCVGISRLERWLRATAQSLKPPEEVLDILECLDDDDPGHQAIFDGKTGTA